MSAPTLAYHLRPNKAIERDIFLDLLGTLHPVLPLSQYQYVGLGGPFLEDFRLIHKRIGVKSLFCIEKDPDVHARQEFNRASPDITCLRGDFDSVMSALEFEQPSIVWLDYSDSKNLQRKIQTFADLTSNCSEMSIIKMTLGAELPRALDTNHGNRLNRAKNKLQNFFPPGTTASDMRSSDLYGPVLLKAVEIAISQNRRPNGPQFVGVCSYLYRDGAPMLTVTGILVPDNDEADFLERTRIPSWEHFNPTWTTPKFIEVPILSLLEQRTIGLEGAKKAVKSMGFSVPEGMLVKDRIENYEQYARLYPHFARVEA